MTFDMVYATDSGYVNLFPIAWIVLANALVIVWLRTRNIWHLIFATIFGVYLLFAIATFFPMWRSYQTILSLNGILRRINLVPFNYDFNFNPDLVWLRIFHHILLTVPFGFGISFVVRLKPKHFLWLVPAVGLAREGAEFILALLGVGRTIDINDVILNGLGVLIGYLLFRVFAWLYLRAGRRFDVLRRGIFGYVYDVTVGADGCKVELTRV